VRSVAAVQLVDVVRARLHFRQLQRSMRRRIFLQALTLIGWQVMEIGWIDSAGANELFDQRQLEMGRLIFHRVCVGGFDAHGRVLTSVNSLCALYIRMRVLCSSFIRFRYRRFTSV